VGAKNKKYFYDALNALSHNFIDFGYGLPPLAKMLPAVAVFRKKCNFTAYFLSRKTQNYGKENWFWPAFGRLCYRHCFCLDSIADTQPCVNIVDGRFGSAAS
jgi:hypothetical protein